MGTVPDLATTRPAATLARRTASAWRHPAASPGAAHIENLAGLGGDGVDPRRTDGDDAGLAPGQDQAVQLQLAPQPGASRQQRREIRRRHAEHLGQLGGIRRDGGRAPVALPVPALGIDQDRQPSAPGRRDQPLAQLRRQGPLGVVGQDHRLDQRQQARQGRQQPLRGGGPGADQDLVVDPDDLLPPGHHALLDDGGAARIRQQRLPADAGPVEQGAELGTGGIGADDAGQGGPDPEPGQVHRHVGGPARVLPPAGHPQHRHRRLGRQAGNLAGDIAVE